MRAGTTDDFFRWLCRVWLGLGILAYPVLLWLVLPWWQAANHPVHVEVSAPVGTPMALVLEDELEPLPLVPIGTTEGGTHRFWGTELPPRPDYVLSLSFPEGTDAEVVFHGITFIELSHARRDIRWSPETLSSENPARLRLRVLEDGWGIRADAGAEVPLSGLPPALADRAGFSGWSSFTLTYIALSVLGLLIVVSCLRFPAHVLGRREATPYRETVVLFLLLAVGSAIHLHLVGESMPDYWPADSTSYAMKSVALVTEGTYDTGTHEYELNRMPGFPVFMALVFMVAGWNLNAVTLTQGILFCLAVTFLCLNLRHLVRGYWIGLAGLGALVSPPAVWASRQIATESTFVSIWILSLAAFLFLWQRRGKWRWVGFVVFGIGATVAVAIRPNGILLLALPGMLFTGTVFFCVFYHGKDFFRLPVLWRTVGQVTIPCAMVLLFVFAWSWRNYESRGYGKPTDLTEIVHANAPFFAGTFDIRAARDAPEYAWFVNERNSSGFWFHGWSLRKYRFQQITDQYRDIGDGSIARLEAELAEFNAASAERIPLRAKLVGWFRVGGWGLWFPDKGAYTVDPLNQDYSVLTAFPGKGRADHVHRNLKWATRNVEERITIEETTDDPWIDAYNRLLVPVYPWIYRALLAAALLGWLAALVRKTFTASAFVIPFMLNVLLNIYFLYIIGRYVQVLDAALWMAALTGLAALSANSLQSSIPDQERRCLNAKIPEHLLTRFANAPGTRK
jgi:hypothetical protein